MNPEIPDLFHDNFFPLLPSLPPPSSLRSYSSLSLFLSFPPLPPFLPPSLPPSGPTHPFLTSFPSHPSLPSSLPPSLPHLLRPLLGRVPGKDADDSIMTTCH